MDKMLPPEGYDDNPEWTDETEARARPAAELLGAELAAALSNDGGQPVASETERVAIKLDRDAVDRFRAAGPGWQSRINAAVRKAAGLG